MRTTLRSLTFGLATLFGLGIMAQFPHTLQINGVVNGCYPGQSVTISTTGGTIPPYTIDVPVNPNTCTYSVALTFGSNFASYTTTTLCGGLVLTVHDSAFLVPNDTTLAIATLNCGTSTPDCEGVLGGTALPGTPCATPAGAAGTWGTDCMCEPNPPTCQACFTIEPAGNGGMLTPFVANFINCTNAGTAPYSYAWWLPNGAASAQANETFTFPGEGIYGVCLTITDANACTSTVCDSVYVDANGGISTNATFYDCLQIPNGPNVPGAPCQIPGTILTGTWNANCECISNEPVECSAAFFAMQAYQWVDSAANPNGGGGAIVPNEVWVWNLSVGAGDMQYLWSFGDGTSSTEAFPTHTYASSGTYQLCLTISDNTGCTATYCDAITIDNDGILGGFMGEGNRSTWTLRVMNALSTGVNDTNDAASLNTWPNPVSDRLNVQLDNRVNGAVAVAIVDMSGRAVHMEKRSMAMGTNQLAIPVAQLRDGVYTVLVNDGTRTISHRFAKVD